MSIVEPAELTPRMQRAIARAQGFIRRITTLTEELSSPILDDAAREKSLVALEALVLSNRGSAEVDHRKQLVLSGLDAAVEAFLVEGSPRAAELAASAEPDALLAEVALAELLVEYPDEAVSFSSADVARAVRAWAEVGRQP